MTAPRLFGSLAANGSSSANRSDSERPLSELSLSFVPLAVVAEWTRCSEAADFVARYFAHDFGDRELAGNVLSTVVNELLENAVKFSSDKSIPAGLTVREYAERMSIVSRNVASPSQAVAFGDAVARLAHGDPEQMFADRIASPPETGGAGIGLIMLRKDYGARVGVRVTPSDGDRAAIVDVEVEIDNREVEGA
ncbi:MAG TPA: hypothetical protein VLN49_16430 [Gemmatimonadaceae bacterium]|nr:hypothetical protein [Gemmatimonadaceae bacterium]